MEDAYYPAQDPGIMATSPAFAPHDPARAAAADRRRDFAPLVPDTRRARFAVLENHCRQARAGYFYCEQTAGDPCGWSRDNRYPHAGCSDAECTAPHTCGDLGAYAAATEVPAWHGVPRPQLPRRTPGEVLAMLEREARAGFAALGMDPDTAMRGY